MDSLGRLRPYLRDDEQLLWHGGPDPQVRLGGIDVLLVYLSAGYGVALVVCWCMVLTGHGGLFYYFGVTLTLAWLSAVGQLFYRRYSLPRTAYGITTTRALSAGPQRLHQKPLHDEPFIINRSRDARHVTVVVGVAPARTRKEDKGPGPGRQLRFEAVTDPEGVLVALSQAGAWLAPPPPHGHR